MMLERLLEQLRPHIIRERNFDSAKAAAGRHADPFYEIEFGEHHCQIGGKPDHR
jgi:hypothetical protein